MYRVSIKKVSLYIFIAYIFALFFRLFLFFVAKEYPEFFYHNSPIAIWTADAGLYGSYAKKLINGLDLQLSSETFLSFIIYYIAKILHIDLDSVIFFLPAFLASLIVVPIVLIFYELSLVKVGFWSALAASIAMNYYFRTHLGYCDTDILNFVLFFMILYSFIALLRSKNLLFAAIAAFLIIFFNLFYHSAKPLSFGMVIFFAIYMILFDRQNISGYFGFLIVLIPFLPIASSLKIAVIVIVTLIGYFLQKSIKVDYRILFAIFLVIAVGVGIYGQKHGYIQRAMDYLQKKQSYALVEKGGKKIELEATLKTVAEASGITPSQLVTYSSGNIVLFILGSLGLLLLMKERKEAILLLLPYLIGLISLKAGVRFTTFMVVPIVSGNIYLFYLLSQKLRFRFSSYLFYIPAFALVVYYLHIMQMYNHMLKPFFIKNQIVAIKTYLDQKDRGYILTWWDYGWPLWYYTNKRTIIDNGKHHYDNYIIAKTLFSYDQEFVAKMDRYFVERFDKIYPWAVLPYVIKELPLKELLQKIANSKLKMEKQNSVYYYFDDRIITKLPIIENFSYLKGEPKRGFVWVDKLRLIDPKKGVVAGQSAKIDLKRGVIYVGKKQDKIGTIYFSNGEKITNVLPYRRNNYAIIIYKNRYVIGAYRYINSFFFQAFFFNNLDKRVFKTLTFNKDAKIFKLVGM